MSYIDDTAGASSLPRHSLLPVDVSSTTFGEDAHLQLLGELQSSHPVLLHWMRCKLGDRELAADLLNHAVLNALEQQRSGRLHRGGNLAGHVFKVGMNLLREQRRKLEKQPHLHLATDAVSAESEEVSAETGHDERLRRSVRQLLESLSSQRDRQIVTQFYLEGTDKESLCRQFSISGLQFNVIVAGVRQRMKAMLDAGSHG